MKLQAKKYQIGYYSQDILPPEKEEGENDWLIEKISINEDHSTMVVVWIQYNAEE